MVEGEEVESYNLKKNLPDLNKKLLLSFKKYLDIKKINFDTSEFGSLDVLSLAKIICVISPLDYLTKQMLLEFDASDELCENLISVLEIEVNNFGYLTKDGDEYYTYANTKVHPNNVTDLGKKWRGKQYWHAYSDEQIESLRKLILHISEIHGIDVSIGLKDWLSKEDAFDAFGYKDDAFYGKVKLTGLKRVDASDDEIDSFIEEFNLNFKADINLEEGEEDLNEKIKVSDLEINFIKNINSNNENILFIHGFGGDLNNWMFNQNELSEKFNTYAIDLPGHGMSEKNIHNSSLDDLANLISSFCIANDINSVNLVGHSFGSGISIKTASLYPDLINSLTLISPIGLGKEIDSTYLENFINAESRRDLKKEIEKLYFNSDIITRDMLNEVLKFLRIDNVQTTLAKIQNEIIINGEQKNNLINEINSIKIPVCVVWGKEDQIIPSNHHKVLNDNIKIIIEKDCGHMAHIEKPSVVNDAINSTIVG